MCKCVFVFVFMLYVFMMYPCVLFDYNMDSYHTCVEVHTLSCVWRSDEDIRCSAI